jgi:para-nitrobenzyl esterase
MKIMMWIAALVASASLTHPATAQTARVKQGTLHGMEQDGAAAYLGIPYAVPPVGADRWKAPQPAADWTGTRDATHFGASCAQLATGSFGPFTTEYVEVGKTSEDCLYLNVWTTAKRGERRPVLFWIHGGAFLGGSGSVPVYNGAELAKRGVVVVNINYRLGVFGFLAHPELTREAGASGNYALMDMIAALRWVHNNIAAFGGDPDHVTIAGQSAGSAAVHDLIGSPEAKGLFVGAIAESGSGLGGPMGTVTLKAAETSGAQFAAALGASSIADLRKLPAEALMQAAGGNPMTAKYHFGPIVDGRVLVADPLSLPAGGFNDTPVLTGLNADEGSVAPGYGASTVAAVRASIEHRFGSLATQAEALYPAADDRAAGAVSLALARDGGVANTFLWAERRAAKSAKPVYVYYFAHPEPGPNAAIYGAFHTAEVPYVFQTFAASPDRTFTAEDRRLSDQMADYWVNFVRTGNPNGSGLPQWPAFKQRDPAAMTFTDEPAVKPLLSPKKYELYRQMVAGGGSLSMF